MKHRNVEAPREARLALQRRGASIEGNLATAAGQHVAWFFLPSQQWSFRSDDDRAAQVEAAANTWAGLAGHSVHLRGTLRPYPASHWARGLHRNRPNALPGFSDYLVSTQEHLRSQQTSMQEWYLGVNVRDDAGLAEQARDVLRFLRRRGRSDPDGTNARTRLRHAADEVAELVGGPGLGAQPVTGQQIAWLVERSVALGLPAQDEPLASHDVWDADDMFSLSEQAIIEPHPFGKCVRVTDASTEVSRFVVGLVMGPMDEINTPAEYHTRAPWLAHATTRLPFPVEVSCRVDVLDGREAASDAERKLTHIRDQQHHYAEHDMDEPLILAKQAVLARQIEDDMRNGSPSQATRVHGYVRFAVWGDTEEVALSRARELIRSYGARGMTVVRPRAQYDVLREFVPGEPIAATGYYRRLPVRYWAAGYPALSTEVGDNRGPLLGRIVGTTRRAVMFDTHYAMEDQDGSGLTAVVGQLGSGKSSLMGQVIYDGVLGGIHSTVFDPSGPLAKLTEMPELAAVSRHIALTAGADGTLNPYRVVSGHNRLLYPADEAGEIRFRADEQTAEAARKELALEVFRMMLPPPILMMPNTEPVLLNAIDLNGGLATGSPWGVIEKLKADPDPHGEFLARLYKNMSSLPLANLLFPAGPRQWVDDPAKSDALLTVMTMPGLVIPSARVDRMNWTNEERLAMPLLHLATRYATRAMYERPMHERKSVYLDEMRQLANWSAGQALVVRWAVDSRKHNTRVVTTSQNPSHILEMGDVANLIGSVLVGRIKDEETASQCCRLLGIPEHDGFEDTLRSLSAPIAGKQPPYRDFVLRDDRGRVEIVRIDQTHRPELMAALNTRPTQVLAEADA